MRSIFIIYLFDVINTDTFLYKLGQSNFLNFDQDYRKNYINL
jgi:hypothetical protein